MVVGGEQQLSIQQLLKLFRCQIRVPENLSQKAPTDKVIWNSYGFPSLALHSNMAASLASLDVSDLP